MTATVFVDANVLLYAFEHANPQKQAAARLWRAELDHETGPIGRSSFARSGVLPVLNFESKQNAHLHHAFGTIKM
jgi:predicted nucleic acid-binding protein